MFHAHDVIRYFEICVNYIIFSSISLTDTTQTPFQACSKLLFLPIPSHHNRFLAVCLFTMYILNSKSVPFFVKFHFL